MPYKPFTPPSGLDSGFGLKKPTGNRPVPLPGARPVTPATQAPVPMPYRPGGGMPKLPRPAKPNSGPVQGIVGPIGLSNKAPENAGSIDSKLQVMDSLKRAFAKGKSKPQPMGGMQ